MQRRPLVHLTAPLFAIAVLLLALNVSHAQVQVHISFNPTDKASTRFEFQNAPSPVTGDAAEKATWELADGEPDPNGGPLSRLSDGKLPTAEDQPAQNFFFRTLSDGGRIHIDLGTNVLIQQINTYSWHGASRAHQVYKVYGSPGTMPDFKAKPPRAIAPESCGWTRVAQIDTRNQTNSLGGQYAVSISNPRGDIGSYRHLLFEIARTDPTQPFDNTFYSEMDVIEQGSKVQSITNNPPKPITHTFTAGNEKYHFILDTTLAPDLTEWALTRLQPVVQEWYPKLVELLPSENFKPRTQVTLRFREDMGGTPASAGGGFIHCNAPWFRKELKREALGSVVHEMVHVVQSYGRPNRDDPKAKRMPGWLVEGIPDYIRWYLYEPQTQGAEITTRNLSRAKYDASYRITANFLNWVSANYDPQLVLKLNAAGRASGYNEELWKELTGKTVQELGDEWRRFHEKKLGVTSESEKVSPANTPVPSDQPKSK